LPKFCEKTFDENSIKKSIFLVYYSLLNIRLNMLLFYLKHWKTQAAQYPLFGNTAFIIMDKLPLRPHPMVLHRASWPDWFEGRCIYGIFF
jgi:hypothetical protein